ncbi:ATP-dependent protease La [Kwoniella dejecticola CBS 10117]|uniref:Lon protease homolog n=1 Tax=Kwoniella dejecticola CBS 10117 TaxID=1296121 RepID=A0A1A5ZWR2_9TREE|nr:ATP-dependent protease La [Kwoniella dejecticola CBS 10117]OBR82243.1 ATP-dependent protease La [Kwoniella dejecticola CBS 10117]
MTTPLLPSSLPLIPLRPPQVLFPHLRASIPLSSTQLALVLDAVQSNLGGKGGNGERGIVGVVPVADHDRRVGRWGCAARIKSIQKSSDEDDSYILLAEGLTRIRLPRSLPPVLSILPSIPLPTSPYSLAIPATIPSTTDLLPLALRLLPEQLHSRVTALPASLLADILVTILGVEWDLKVELLGIPDIEARCTRVKEILLDLLNNRGIKSSEGSIDQKQENPLKSNALILRPKQPLTLSSSSRTPKSTADPSKFGDTVPEDLKPLFELYQSRSSELSKNAIETVDRELKRLCKIPPQSAEYGVARTYIEWILALPFKRVSENYEINLKQARKRLDEDHEGLEKVKKRVVEYLAVYRLKRQLFLESQEKKKLLNSPTAAEDGKPKSAEKLDEEVENNLLQLIPASERQNAQPTEGHTNNKNDDEPPTDVYRDKGPILLLVGPPGVGKTSIAKSLADSLGRKFHRISLGGVRDEAEIRGHRRTYVGALPGLLVQAMRKVRVSNPLILLDELDKVGHGGFHGDPSAALLEALDPAQNWNFHDHYLGDVPIDLSQVLFIATANQLDSISWPLLDRCEVIECSGYITPEKVAIAKKFLLPKQIKECGLDSSQIQVDEGVLEKLVVDYTREAGVRNLERQIGKLCRSKAVEYSISREPNESTISREAYEPTIASSDIERILGVSHHSRERPESDVRPGVVNGLSYSGSGNGNLLIIETLLVPGGSGRLVTTGRLGEVFRESIELCLTWVKSRSLSLGITNTPSENPLKGYNVHYHIPEGAIRKDGPSAGIATVLAFVSLLTGRPVSSEIAMTGEMSLRGSCLRIGGVKEKVIGAHRAGVKKIILPRTNRPDVMADVPELVKKDIEFVFVDKIEQAIEEVWGKEIWAGGEGASAKVDARL